MEAFYNNLTRERILEFYEESMDNLTRERIMGFYQELMDQLRQVNQMVMSGNPFDAVELLFGPDWALFIQKKVYRKILIFIWRATTIHYPLRYKISNYFGSIAKNITHQIDWFKIPTTSTIVPCSETPRAADADPNIFPMEIWEEIVQYDVNPANLLGVNRALCDFFAPRFYADFNMSLVLSNTKKMRLNDACFLKYGPDFLEDWPNIDSYAIYERHQRSHLGFEFLDISKGPQDEFEEYYCDDLMTNHKRIIFIFENILSNPKSILKQYIKSVSISVQIIHGLNDVLHTETREGRTIADHLRLKLNSKMGVSLAARENGYISTMAIQDIYHGDRWESEDSSVLSDMFYRASQRGLHFTKKEFPERVYIKELLKVAIMLNFLQKRVNRDRIRSVKHSKDLSSVNPFGEFNNYRIGRFGKAPSLFREPGLLSDYLVEYYVNLGLKEINQTHIDSRDFYTADYIHDTILMIIKAMSCNDTNNTINCSLLFNYQTRRDKYEVKYGERRNALFNRTTFYPIAPATLVLNKPIFVKPDPVEKEIRREKKRIRLDKKNKKKKKGKKKKKN